MISGTMYSVQCQITMVLHVIANSFDTKNGEQEIPSLTAQKSPKFPQFATHDFGSTESDTSEASKEQKDGRVSDV